MCGGLVTLGFSLLSCFITYKPRTRPPCSVGRGRTSVYGCGRGLRGPGFIASFSCAAVVYLSRWLYGWILWMALENSPKVCNSHCTSISRGVLSQSVT